MKAASGSPEAPRGATAGEVAAGMNLLPTATAGEVAAGMNLLPETTPQQ